MFNFFNKKSTPASDTTADVAISNALLQNIITNLTDAVVVYDEHFVVTVFNNAAAQLFTLRAADVIGKTISIAQAQDARLQRLVQVVFPSLAPSVVSRSESGAPAQIIDLNLEGLNLRVVTSKVVDANGALQGFVKVIRDRTREVSLLKSKSDFLIIAAHQLRTPLTAVGWAFEGLEKEGGLPVSAGELVSTGALAAKQLTKIVDDLLTAAKFEEGKFGYTFQENDLAVFLDEVCVAAQPIGAAYNVSVFLESPKTPLPRITFDSEKLSIVLSNLIDNAIKYNVQNGSVTVGAQLLLNKPYVLVSVKDTGVGIPPEAMKKLFTKFFRAENVVKFSTDGSGLGLYMTKNIVERHGGRIWVESELNRGTTFYFTLPIDPALIPQKELITEED